MAPRPLNACGNTLIQAGSWEGHDFTGGGKTRFCPCFWVAQRRGPQHARFWRDGVESRGRPLSPLPSQRGLDWHSCLRGQPHKQTVFIVSLARWKAHCRPWFNRRLSPATPHWRTTARTAPSSVIVFWGVSQCPLVHVQLRRWDAQPARTELGGLSYDPSDFALRRDSSYR